MEGSFSEEYIKGRLSVICDFADSDAAIRAELNICRSISATSGRKFGTSGVAVPMDVLDIPDSTNGNHWREKHVFVLNIEVIQCVERISIPSTVCLY